MVRIKLFIVETFASIGLVDLTKVSNEIVTLSIVLVVRVAFFFLEKRIIRKKEKNA